MKKENIVKDLFSFIDASPVCYFAVENICEILKKQGFEELSEKAAWALKSGKLYFVKRNDSSLIAFSVPEKLEGFNVAASHSDSPCFKVKENPEMESSGCIKLNVEKYGGMLMKEWFDRPLSVAGRLAVKGEKSPSVKTVLVNADTNLLMIPSLAIHMDRNANSEHEIDVQNELMPVAALNKDFNLKKYMAEKAGVNEDEVTGFDLFVYNRDKGTVWGAENEFISSPRLDDLECVWTTLQGFLSSVADKTNAKDRAAVYAVFDNEETGSRSFQGAASTFLKDTLSRINLCLGGTEEDYMRAVASSFMLSADNAHAVHPNYVSKADPVNRPVVNGGPVLKFNASQKYTTDAVSAGVFKELCKKAGVPCQVYTNNSNIAGGSTLGNISSAQVSMPSADIGIAQWAMHSPNESAGAKDVEQMISVIREFYNSSIEL